MKAAIRTPLPTAIPFFAAILVASTACESSGPPSNWSTVRETLPSGAILVTNTPSANPSPTLTLVEELRVGSLEGGRPESFAALKGLVALPGGGFAVLDSQAQEIRVFGADGSHVATHGRPGEGPGEFVDATGLMLDPQGRIWAADPRGARMSVFDPVDGFVESFRYQYMVRGFIWAGTMTDRGHILKQSMSRQDFRPMLRVYDSTMTQIDSIFSAEEDEGGRTDPEDSPGAFYYETPGGGYGLMRIPFYPGGTSHMDRNGERWFGRMADPGYRIGKHAPGGDTTLIVVTERPPVPVTAAERDSAIAVIRENLRESGVTTEMDWSRIPDVKPALQSIFTSAEGNVWVAIPNLSGGTDYDVLASDGSYLGTVTAGHLGVYRWLPPVVVGDTFLAVVSDELDVPYVVLARIVPVEHP
ncbi:MAG: hypothetical protein F4139_03220 [Gemmatimonadetes bacterium]|nr:hypothetical protein [Gemmatimonadota bacterium]MYH51945.1 hypothetical protein [Gemmatimonadota bacterium]MYK66409.1 hypothetical protein [Gemmatimonadota bacterium]